MDNAVLVGKIDTVIRFFLYVLIFWLPYSPAVIESCVIICFILWLSKRAVIFIQQKEPKMTFKERLSVIGPESSFLNKPIAFFLLACILSVTGSVFWEQSLHNFLTKTLEWFIIYFLVIEAFRDRKHIYIAFAVLIFTAFSTVIDSLIQFYITHKDIFLGHVIDPGGRATAGFKTPNGLGAYLTVVVPGLLAWIFLGKQKFRHRLSTLLILLLMMWSLITTSSRGAWIGTFFGGVFLLVFILFTKKRLKLYLSSGLLWMIIFLCMVFFLILADGSDQRLLERIVTIRWRLDVWIVSIGMIKDKLFFGHGINTFMKLFQIYRGNPSNPTYAHNCYIQMAAETGLVGLFSFFWIVAEMFRHSLGRIKFNFEQNRNLGALMIGLLSGISAFLIHSFFDANFYSLQLSAYLWFLIGMLIAIYKVFDTGAFRKV